MVPEYVSRWLRTIFDRARQIYSWTYMMKWRKKMIKKTFFFQLVHAQQEIVSEWMANTTRTFIEMQIWTAKYAGRRNWG